MIHPIKPRLSLTPTLMKLVSGFDVGRHAAVTKAIAGIGADVRLSEPKVLGRTVHLGLELAE